MSLLPTWDTPLNGKKAKKVSNMQYLRILSMKQALTACTHKIKYICCTTCGDDLLARECRKCKILFCATTNCPVVESIEKSLLRKSEPAPNQNGLHTGEMPAHRRSKECRRTTDKTKYDLEDFNLSADDVVTPIEKVTKSTREKVDSVRQEGISTQTQSDSPKSSDMRSSFRMLLLHRLENRLNESSKVRINKLVNLHSMKPLN